VIAVGLMSGTSLDGIDAALVEIRPRGAGYAIELLGFATYSFDAELAHLLRSVLPPNPGSVATVAAAHRDLGAAFARAALGVAGSTTIDFVASHGQTLWHDGAHCITLQLGDAFVIRAAARATVCYDFRSADCAAGGHGAPLVPYVDALLFADAREDRVALNLGGIANVTLLAASTRTVTGFDTGPGNMLVDAFVRRRTSDELPFDREGALAATGRVDEALLSRMLSDGYFALSPPKSTGRERFGSQFLDEHGEGLARLSLEDGAATLTELTAASIAGALAAAGFSPERVIVSGGGASNPALLSRISARLDGALVERSDVMGVPADAKEAIAFAVLGYETLRGRAANLPAVTGAREAVSLGAIAPYDVRALLAKVEAECATAD
jgi:anhydro-N-acetylmuramic acid kinase